LALPTATFEIQDSRWGVGKSKAILCKIRGGLAVPLILHYDFGSEKLRLDEVASNAIHINFERLPKRLVDVIIYGSGLCHQSLLSIMIGPVCSADYRKSLELMSALGREFIPCASRNKLPRVEFTFLILGIIDGRRSSAIVRNGSRAAQYQCRGS
jgi:hypothetical protein